MSQDESKVVIESSNKKSRLEINFAPIHIAYYVNGILKITINDKNLFYFEVTRSKVDSTITNETLEKKNEVKEKKIVDYTEAGHAIYEDGSIEGETAEMESEVTTEGDTIPSTEDQANKSSIEEPVSDDKEDETGYWEEYFGGKTDSKPYGPQSVGADITFHGVAGLYGIPQHSSSFKLQTTLGGSYTDPYRLFNLDVFEFATNKPAAL